ncbi:MAG: DNA polymerase [Minisyncoccia bacterium]
MNRNTTDRITPLAGTANPKDEFVVCDIENESTGEVIAIGVSYRNDAGEIVHQTFEGWQDFTHFVVDRSTLEQKFTRIWAHNGGGWDWCSYFSWLIEHKHQYPHMEIFPVIVATKYVVLQVDFNVQHTEIDGKIERDCISVRFCDSLYLMRSSLEDLSQKFLGRGKVKTDMMAWDLYRKDRIKFFAYLAGDCQNLLEILEKFYGIIRENICALDRLGNTIGGTALRIFRTEAKPFIIIPSDEKGHKELRENLRSAYYGGRVEVFQYGHFNAVNVYDINSLYPFAMREFYYPINSDTCGVKEYRPHLPGIYNIRFRQFNRNLPAVMVQKGKAIYEGEGRFFAPEIGLLKKVGAEIEILEGIVFKNSRKIFTEFIDKMWTLRKSDYKGPLGLICKFLMNSLYGKFCERPKYTKLMLLNGAIYENIKAVCEYEIGENQIRAELGKKPIKIDILDEEKGVYLIVDDDAICPNEHVGIGGTITSWARVILYEKFLASDPGKLIYCDTDSIHTFGTMPTGTDLGELKLEHSGEAVYCGKKLYALRGEKDGKPYEKVTAKGVSFCSSANPKDHQFILNFDDMLRIYNGAEIQTVFSQPATAKGILKGEKPCQILRRTQSGTILHNRKRKLRRT